LSSDKRLLEQARNGDAKAWDALVDGYSALVYSIFRAVGVGEQQAGSLTLEVFEDLLCSLDPLSESSESLFLRLARMANRKALAFLIADGSMELAAKRIAYARAFKQARFLATVGAVSPKCQHALVLFMAGLLPDDSSSRKLRSECLRKLRQAEAANSEQDAKGEALARAGLRSSA
jgi:hypothetical protein